MESIACLASHTHTAAPCPGSGPWGAVARKLPSGDRATHDRRWLWCVRWACRL